MHFVLRTWRIIATILLVCVLLEPVCGESNDTWQGADFVVLDGGKTSTGLGSTTDIDWFYTEVSEEGELEWGVYSLSNGPVLTFTVYHSASQVSGTPSTTLTIQAGDNDSATIAVSPGTYYLKVYSGGALGNGYFSVEASFTPEVHTVSQPDTPSGTISGYVDTEYTYTTGGAVCDQGHPIEYHFEWDDGSVSSWDASTSASHTWTSPGTYYVKAQARCDGGEYSDRSNSLTVSISETPHVISKPQTPSGPSSGITGNAYQYSTSATCNQGHQVQYRFGSLG